MPDDITPEGRLKLPGVTLDDFIEDEHGKWSQVCNACYEKHIWPLHRLDSYPGGGICGVQGCRQQADCYIDLQNNYKEQ